MTNYPTPPLTQAYNEIVYPLKPLGIEIANPIKSYNIILESFGLSLLKPKIYDNLQGASHAQDSPALKYNSLLGTPIFSYITLTNPSDKTQALTCYSCLMEVTMDRNVVVTKVQGRDGDIIEFIGNSNYNVIIRGAIVSGYNNVYPVDDVELLTKKLLIAPNSLDVTSPFLSHFNIHNIVVTGYAFPQKEGYNDMQIFEIRAISDDPVYIRIKKDGR
jgi:hypothetical protein